MQKENRIKKIILVTTAILAIVIITVIVDRKMRFAKSQKEFDIDFYLRLTAVKINKEAPIIVDHMTRLDSVTAVQGPGMIYNYTLIGEGSAKDKKAIVRHLDSIVRNKTLKNEDMLVFRENKVNVTYIYYNTDGKELGRIVVNAGEYE